MEQRKPEEIFSGRENSMCKVVEANLSLKYSRNRRLNIIKQGGKEQNGQRIILALSRLREMEITYINHQIPQDLKKSYLLFFKTKFFCIVQSPFLWC